MSDGPVIEPGREAEILALFAPYALGGEVAPGAVLRDVVVEARRVRAVVRTARGDGAIALVHPDDAPGAPRASGSFALLVEPGAPAEAGPALDALASAVVKNDAGAFWRGAPRAAPPPPEPEPPRGLGWVAVGALLLGLLAARRRSPPRGVEADAAARRAALASGALVGLAAAGMTFALRAVETDDAYAVLRYARNLARRGELVYNAGERVAAFTSPLHALALSGAGALGLELPAANRALGVTAFLGSLALVWRALPDAPGVSARRLALALAAASPYAIHWALGGLETPLVGLFVTAATALWATERHAAVGCAAGLALVTRLDAAVFLLPTLALGPAGARARALRLGLAALPPVAWALFSLVHYGDPLPTSFYVKTPRLSEGRWLLENSLYSFEFLVFSGLAAVLGAAALVSPERLRGAWRAAPGPWLGLAGVLAYGVAASTTHLFYAFRLFVPYLGPAAILACAAWARPEDEPRRRRLFGAVLALGAAGCASLAPAGGNLSGSRSGEMREVGAVDAARWVHAFGDAARAVEADWRAAPAGDRPMRVATVAQGALAWALEDAIVYERHAAYRHRCKRSAADLARAADYVVLVTPYPKEVAHDTRGWRLVHAADRDLGGVTRTLEAWRNPAPEQPDLPPRVDQPCLRR